MTSFAIELDFAKSYGKVKIKTSKPSGATTMLEHTLSQKIVAGLNEQHMIGSSDTDIYVYGYEPHCYHQTVSECKGNTVLRSETDYYQAIGG